jgi:hypothetical protein
VSPTLPAHRLDHEALLGDSRNGGPELASGPIEPPHDPSRIATLRQARVAVLQTQPDHFDLRIGLRTPDLKQAEIVAPIWIDAIVVKRRRQRTAPAHCPADQDSGNRPSSTPGRPNRGCPRSRATENYGGADPAVA